MKKSILIILNLFCMHLPLALMETLHLHHDYDRSHREQSKMDSTRHVPAAGADLSHGFSLLKAVSEWRKSWPGRCLINKCLPSECATSVHSHLTAEKVWIVDEQ